MLSKQFFAIFVIFVSYSVLAVYHRDSKGGNKDIVLVQPDRFHLRQCPVRRRRVASSPRMVHTSPTRNVGRGQKKQQVVVVTKVVYVVKPKKKQPMNSERSVMQKPVRRVKRLNVVTAGSSGRKETASDNIVEKSGRKRSKSGMPNNEFNAEWWGKKKPKSPDNENPDSMDDLEKRHSRLIRDFNERKAQRGDNGVEKNLYSDFKIMERQIDSDDSKLFLDVIREEEDMASSMKMQSMRSPKVQSVEGEVDASRVPTRLNKGCVLSRVKNRISRAFNHSFEDPIARLFVAIALGLITTLGVYALISLAKILIMKEDDFELVHGTREFRQSPYHYAPIPQ